MKISIGALLTAGLLLLGSPARADDQADLRRLLAKAIQALGGEANVTKFKAATYKGKGTLAKGGATFTFEAAFQGHDKIHSQLAFGTGRTQILIVFNGDKGWIQANKTMDIESRQLQQIKTESYARQVAALGPLTMDKQFTLSPMGETTVQDRPAVGIQVTRKGHPDVNLFFDKETNLLLKREMRVNDPQDGNREKTQETLYRDYKEINGIKVPMGVTVKRDGEVVIEIEIAECEPAETLDDSLFAKP